MSSNSRLNRIYLTISTLRVHLNKFLTNTDLSPDIFIESGNVV